MRILALSMAAILTCTCVPVNASTGNDIPYSSAYSLTGWLSDLWDRITGQDDKQKEESADAEPVELQVVESEDTVENGDMLRAATYAVEAGTSSRAAEDIRYFPVTLYNYDTATINNATHQAEIEAGTAEDKWTGLYFNNGTPAAESYTYSSGEGQAVSNLTWRTLISSGTTYYLDQECTNPVHTEEVRGETYERSYPDCSDVISSNSSNRWMSTNYYYTPDGGENYYPLYAQRNSYRDWITYYNYTWGYSVTDSSSNVTHIGTQDDVSSWSDERINIAVYTRQSGTTGYRLLDSSDAEVERLNSTNTNQRVNTTLYTNAPITTDTLGFAAYNFWTGNINRDGEGQASAGGNGYRVYNGLVQSTLDASGNIRFNVPEGGIFNSDRSVKDIYTNVGLPFEYENGMYTFDSSVMNARFDGEAASNTKLGYYDSPQKNGTSYSDGSSTLWLPFNNKQEMEASESDYHFGMNATIPFTMTPDGTMVVSGDREEDIVFSFSGDDDVWIFIDGQLVLDLGGIHNRVDAELNFAENTWRLKRDKEHTIGSSEAANIDGSSTSGAIFNSGYVKGILNQTRESFAATDEHNLTIFYLERGEGSSNCKIQFNLPVKDSVSVQKLITQSKTDKGEISPLTEREQEMVENTTYYFTLYRNGEPVANTTYQLLNANGQITATPTTNRYGRFPLKNGETAKFIENIPETEEAEYYVVEETLDAYVTPEYTYEASTAGGSSTGETDYSEEGWVSKTVSAKGGGEAEDSISFVCTNYLSANLPNPSLYPQDDQIVIDYGLPVEIENVLENDAWKGDKKELTDVTGAQFGEVTFTPEGKVTYRLTKQLTDVEILTYTAKVTSSGNSGDQIQTEEIEKEGKIYIIPATTMYYEEDFPDLVTYSQGSWQQIGGSQADFQETGEVGDESDSPYGSDKAYLSDSGDSNGTSRYVSSKDSAAKFSYTFTGAGTSFYARTTNNTAYMKVDITDAEGNAVYNLYRDTKYKTEDDSTTLYNIPVFTWYAENPGTYTVTVSLANQKLVPGYGSDFWLDGIRVYKPLSQDSLNYDVAQSAYAVDSEANCTVATLREKLIGEETVYDPETGELIWSEQDQEDGNFVVFTDTNGEILSASEYVSNGPKEEVYLNEGQKVSFALDGWNKNTYNLYLGIKAPMGQATVSINGNEITVGNTPDCYYDISDMVAMTTGDGGEQTGTVEVKSVSGLISVTNIKATGVGEFELVPGLNVDGNIEAD